MLFVLLAFQAGNAFAALGVSKIANPGNIVQAGDTITYTVAATNNGNGSLSDVSIADPNLTNLNCTPAIPVATLAPDGSISCSGVYTVTTGDITAGSINNTVTAHGTDSGSSVESTSSVNISTQATTVRGGLSTQKALASLADNDGDGQASEGDQLNYTITTTNTTAANITNVNVADDLIPSGNLSCTPAHGSTLTPSESMVCTGSYTITGQDVAYIPASQVSLDNFNNLPLNENIDGVDVSVSTNSGTTSENTSSDGISVVQWGIDSSSFKVFTFDFSTSVTDFTTNIYDIDGSTEYVQIHAYNAGGTEIPFDSTWVTLGSYLTLNSFNTIMPTRTVSPGGFTTNPENEAIVNIPEPVAKVEIWARETMAGGRNFGFSNPGWRSPNAKMVYVGQVVNTATATGTDSDSNTVTGIDTSTVTTDPGSSTPGIDTTKILSNWSDTNGNGQLDSNDMLSYTLRVVNTGNTTLNNVSISDNLATANSISLNCTPVATATLAVGESMICTYTYKVKSDDVVAGAISNTATGIATGPNGENVVDKETVVVDTADPQPALMTVKTANTSRLSNPAVAGDMITYTIMVENTGNVTLTGVTITDILRDADGNSLTLTSGPSFSGTSGGDANFNGTVGAPLSVGETAIYTATYKLTQSDILAGGVSNSVVASGTDPSDTQVTDTSDDGDDTDGNTTDDPTETPLTAAPSWQITKTAGDVVYVNGSAQTVPYTFQLENTGNLDISGVTVSDVQCATSPTLNSGDDGDGILGYGETWVYSCIHTVTQTERDAGRVDNTVTAHGNVAGGEPLLDTTDSVTTPLLNVSAISLQKASGFSASPPVPGTTIDFTFNVMNEGTVTLNNVTVNDPKLGQLVPAPAVVCPPSSSNVLASLAPGETVQCVAQYSVTQNDLNGVTNTAVFTREVVGVDTYLVFTNEATVSGVLPSGQGLVAPTSSSTAEARAQLSASATFVKNVGSAVDEDSSGTDSAGDTVTYTYVVENTGNQTLYNVTVAEGSFSGTNGAPMVSGESITMDGGVASGDSSDGVGNDGVWDMLSPGDTVTFTAVYTLSQADVDAGMLTNSAVLTSEAPLGVTGPGGSSGVNYPLIAAPVLAATKIADTSGLSVPVMAGDMISYTITVANTGNVTLTGVTITDMLRNADNNNLTLTSGPTFVSADGSPASAKGTLQVDETATYTAMYRLTQADIDTGGVSNSVMVTGVGPNDTPVTDTSDDGDDTDGNTVDDPTETNLTQNPALTLVKSMAGVSGSVVGGKVSYSLVVSNSGNVTVSNIDVSDPKADAGSIKCMLSGNATVASLVVGASESCTAEHTIIQADLDAGSVTNIATTTGDSPAGTNNVVDTSDTGTKPDGTAIPNPGTVDSDGNSNPGDDPTVTVLPYIDIEFTKTVDKTTVRHGDTVVFTLRATNKGPDAAVNMQVTDVLPAGVTLSTSTPPVAEQGTYNAGTGVWDIGGLSVNQTVTLMITVTVD